MLGLRKIIRSLAGSSAPRAGAASAVVPPPPARMAGGFRADPLCLSAVYRCVKLLSESVANLPVREMRLNGSVYTERRGRLWYLLNVAPSPTMSAFAMWTRAVSDVLMHGNAYIVPVWSEAEMDIGRLQIVRPWCVGYSADTRRYTIRDTEAAIGGEYAEDEVIHLRGMGDGHEGRSVLAYARLTLGVARTGEAETLERMRNGGDIRAIVGNDRSIKGFGKNQEDQLAAAAEDLDAKFAAGQRIVHIPGMVDFRQLSMTSADMQFLESRKFAVRDICRFFGVHPSFVFDDTSNNYKSAEMANAAFLSNTLSPLLRMIETELLRKLVNERDAPFRKFEFSRMGLYACDLQSRASYQKAQLEMGACTVNELRISEDRPPLPGGDAPLVSANLRPLSEAAAPKEP